MAYREPFGIKNLIENYINKKLKKINTIAIYEVSAVHPETYMVKIKNPNFKLEVYDDVPIMGMGLGNAKGMMTLPAEGDLVIVSFVGVESLRPIVLGTIFNFFGQNIQSIPQISEEELFLNNKEYGSYIVIKKENDIILRTVDSSGTKKAVITIKSDGNINIDAASGKVVTINGGSLGVARVDDAVNVQGITGVSDSHTHTIDINGTITVGSSNLKN